MEEKTELVEQIAKSIREVADNKELNQIGSLSRHNSIGTSQTRLVRKYGYERSTVISVLTDYADHVGKFKDMAGKIAAKNYFNMSSLEEDLIQEVRNRMETGQLEPTFRDLKELSIAKANAAREALTARGEATNITEDRRVYTQEDYEETIKAARERIKKIKDAEVIDIDDN
mgnify:CR=1 FL=1